MNFDEYIINKLEENGFLAEVLRYQPPKFQCLILR
ncbi:hypothetical protein JOD20_000195 [Herpetosiphon giganteus]|nr:hypothetical protein [Herpetosiphon giganteus]